MLEIAGRDSAWLDGRGFARKKTRARSTTGSGGAGFRHSRLRGGRRCDDMNDSFLSSDDRNESFTSTSGPTVERHLVPIDILDRGIYYHG